MTDTIRILLVDDHPLMLLGIRSMLEGRPGLTVVGAAASAPQALGLLSPDNTAGVVSPDVMVFDIMMPEMNGIELARQMRALHPEVALLALSSDTSLSTLEPLLQIGIDGFLSKSANSDDIEKAIRSVADGYEYFGADIARLIERITEAKAASESLFTPRELDIIRLSCQGLQYKEIADSLGIKYLTVATIKNNIFRKLGINNTVELVLYALRKGLISL